MGMSIIWQDGPLGRLGEERKDPNGAFVETVIHAARRRIEFYQESGFACAENSEAIFHLTQALNALDKRTLRRIQQNTEGTHEGT